MRAILALGSGSLGNSRCSASCVPSVLCEDCTKEETVTRNSRATASGSSATIWDLSTGRELFLLSGGDASIGQVAFSSDGARLLTGGADGTLRIWQVKTGQEMMTLRGHDRGIGSIALSPNDDAFATNGYDGVLRLWRVATPEMVEAQLKDPGLETGLRSIRAGMVKPSAPGTVASSKKP